MVCDRIDLIPERLGIDREALARHHSDLPFERQVIGVLRDGHADPKLRRIPTAREHLRGPRRRHHRAVTTAPIFLSHMGFNLIGSLTVVIRSDVSTWPAISIRSPPQAGHWRSSAGSS